MGNKFTGSKKVVPREKVPAEQIHRGTHSLLHRPGLGAINYFTAPCLIPAMFYLINLIGKVRSTFFDFLIFGWCNGRRPRNVLRKFETIWTRGSLVIAVCSLKLKPISAICKRVLVFHGGSAPENTTSKYRSCTFFYGIVVRGVRNQVRPCTLLHRTTATRPSSTRTRTQKVKARWRTSIQPSLEQSELFCCFSLL